MLNCETLIPPRYHTTRYVPEYIMYAMLDGELYLKENEKEIKLCPGDIYKFKKGHCMFYDTSISKFVENGHTINLASISKTHQQNGQ